MPTFIVKNQIEIRGADKGLDDFICSSLSMPNPLYDQNKRMGRYNGGTPKTLFFYDKTAVNSILTPRGFLPYLTNYCQARFFPFRLRDETHLYDPVNFVFHGELKPFQKQAVNTMLSKNEGTLCAPTGAGKTVMALYLVSQRKQPTIIIVHTKELLNQWVERVKTFLKIPASEIGRIGDGKLETGRLITIALVQTLRNHSDLINDYGYLLVDECHRTPSKTFTNIIKEYSGKYMTGLSATPFRADRLTKVVGWYAGNILVKIPAKDLIAGGDIVGVAPVFRETFFKSELDDPANEYSKLLWELSRDSMRNEMIIEDIINEVKQGETCLVLTDRKDHCQELKSLLLSRRKVATAVLTGSVGSKERKRIIQRVNGGEIKVLIATGNLIGEGFDCNNLSTLFLTLPVKFAGRIIQYVGRVLRPKQGKKEAKIYDYFDPNIKCLYGSLKNREIQYRKLAAKK